MRRFEFCGGLVLIAMMLGVAPDVVAEEPLDPVSWMAKALVQPVDPDPNVSAERYAAACAERERLCGADALAKVAECTADCTGGTVAANKTCSDAKVAKKCTERDAFRTGCDTHEAYCRDPVAYFEKNGSIPALTDLESNAEKILASKTDIEGKTSRTTGGPGNRESALGVDFGTSWQTAVITGLAQFLEDRAKAELALELSKTVTKELCSDDAEARRLFEATCGLLIGLPDGTLAWGAVRAAVRKDVEDLPVTILALLDQRASEKPKREAVFLTSYVGLSLVNAVRSQQDPVRVAAGIGRYIEEREAAAKHPANALCKPASLPCSLWALSKATEVVHEISSKNEASALRHAVAIVLDAAKKKGAAVDDAAQRAVELARAIRRVRSGVRGLLDALDALRKTDPSKARPSELAARIDAVTGSALGMLSGALDVAPLVSKSSGATAAVRDDFVRGMRVAQHLRGAVVGLAQQDYGRAFVGGLAVVQEFDEKLPPGLQKFGGFLVELASVETSEDMTKALESAAAPVGSWRRKLKGWNYGLTGFVGGTFGFEQTTEPGIESSSGYYGVFAPVGVDISYGFECTAVHVMFSFIELGSVLSARTGSTTSDVEPGAMEELEDQGNVPADTDVAKAEVSAAPSYTFAQVLSPGFYVALNLGKSPFLLGGGVAWKPNARDAQLIADDTAGGQKVGEPFATGVFQMQVFFAMDIMIFGF